MSKFCVLSISCILSAFGFLSPPAANAQAGNYNTLVEEARQWQRANADACGKDTSTCGVQRLVDKFESCDGFRIVNGCDVQEPTTVGWQVAVNIGPALCSGTLVSPRHVVLAAHCVKPQTGQTYSASAVTVLVGATNIPRAAKSQRYGADAYAAHPQYTPHPANTNDGAIIKLNRDVAFTANGVRPACLPSSPTRRTFTDCMVGGFGISNVGQHSGAGTLRYTVLQAVSDDACLNLYGPADRGGAFNKAVSFCALGKHHGTGSDTCVGDSGSGLMCKDPSSGRWSLQGIVSYGPQECGQQPGVYAEAFVLGFQVPPPQRALKSDTCSSSASAASSSGSSFGSAGFGTVAAANPVSVEFPASTFGSPPTVGQFGGGFDSLKGVKKSGGLKDTATETIRRNGCTSNDQCQSNSCKQVELCVGFSASNHFRTLFADFLFRDRAALADANMTNTLTSEAEEDEEMMKELKFVSKDDKRCARASICWTSTWLNFYKNKVPTFVF